MKGWDGERFVEDGTERWVCELYHWLPGAESDPERDPVDDTVCTSRAFPSRGLAAAHGRKRAEGCVWDPVVLKERFEIGYRGTEGCFGSWDAITEREEVE